MHTYILTYIYTYIHTTYLLFYLLDFLLPFLTFLPALSPLKTIEVYFTKKLICGVIWFFNLVLFCITKFVQNTF